MTPVQRKRLKRYIAFLRKVPQEHFNMRYWVTYNGILPTSGDVLCSLKNGTCGTAGCAIGWLPVYNPKVFKYGKASLYTNFNRVRLIANPRKSGANAATSYFGIEPEVASQIFVEMDANGPYAYPANWNSKYCFMEVEKTSITPNMVADRLEKYLDLCKKD